MRPLPEAHHDHEREEHEAREQRRVAVEPGPVLVAPVAAEPADRLASSSHDGNEAQAADHDERDETGDRVASDPERGQADRTEDEAEPGQEPFGSGEHVQ